MNRTERIEAIKSLLPWIGAHREVADMATVVRHYHWVSKYDPEEQQPKEAWKLYQSCDGRCASMTWDGPPCPFEGECQGEPWERVYRWLRKAYRINDLEDALADLRVASLKQYRAVAAVYVDPWCEWGEPGTSKGKAEPITHVQRIERLHVANQGVAWLEQHHKMRGRIVGWEVVKAPEPYMQPKERRKRRDRRILEMWGKEKLSVREIASRLGCSDKTVQKALKGKNLKDGCLC